MAADAAVSLTIAHVFGSHCGTGLRDAAVFGDDSGYTIIKPAGRHLTITNTETGESTVMPADERTEGVTACAISRDRKFFAVCERQTGEVHHALSVAIHDLRTVSVRSRIDPFGTTFPRIVALAFGPVQGDGAPLLCAVSSGQEPTVSVMDWLGGRVLARHKVQGPVERLAWSPQADACMLSFSTSRSINLLSLRDLNAKAPRTPYLKEHGSFGGLDEKTLRITDHAWIEPGDGRLVVCASEGTIYVLSSLDMIVVLTKPAAFGLGVTCMPICVRCFSQGFLIGGSEGRVAIWEKVDSGSDQQETSLELNHRRTVKAGKADAAIACMDIAGAEESVLLGFRDADIGILKFSSLYAQDKEVAECSILNGGNHSGPVTCLDTAAQRPLVLSLCRKDCSVRLWNYTTWQCEFCWRSPTDTPNAIALHPFGYFAAVALSEQLRCFYVASTELKPHCSVEMADVHLLRFSNGGHLLVAGQGNLVHVFSTHVVRLIATLEGHAETVSSLCFDPEDHSLWSCDAGGVLMEWDTQDWERLGQHAHAACEYQAASSCAGGTVACAGLQGGRGVVRRFKHGAVSQERWLGKDLRPSAICQYAGSGAAFVATAAGSVLTCLPGAAAHAPAALGLHSGRCLAACLSADGRTLVTAGEDGAIFVLNVHGLVQGDGSEQRPGDMEASRAQGVPSADVMLVNRAYIQQLQHRCDQLRAANAALRARQVREKQQLEDECDVLLRSARAQDQAEIAELTRRCSALKLASEAKERESKRIVNEMESTHAQAAEQLEHLYRKSWSSRRSGS
ncbi:unnamed protein product [Prorocentrum cordatum]|uniref:Cilia- and flagella-associated protein 43 n=1 Tax=Prorocentrum cordatum TaxID=2364126 RepID=A0ABN9TSF6_9DINO|nr:unnamed protein product [Polarella glacialis]